MIPVAEALERVLAGACLLPAENVPLDKAHQRVLAQHLAAKLTQPPFASSAMDGYALRRTDIETPPVVLKIIGKSAAGQPFSGIVNSGETVRIFTGAAVPEGADHIVIQENVSNKDGFATIRQANNERFIRDPGIDFKEGELLLKAGHRLNARDLMLAAQMNYAELPVRRRPRIALLASGDELLPPGSALETGQIISSIPTGLDAMLTKAGADIVRLGIAKDTMGSLLEHIEQAQNTDLLVTIGGASVGDHDLVRPALEKSGFAIAFHKIAMRPGKPLMLGTRGDQRVLGLPGNPVSAMICATIFILPLIAALTGDETSRSTERILPLAAPLPENGPRAHYMRAIINNENGQQQVRALPLQDSSLTATLAKADCLIVRPPHAIAIEAGENVPVLMMPD